VLRAPESSGDTQDAVDLLELETVPALEVLDLSRCDLSAGAITTRSCADALLELRISGCPLRRESVAALAGTLRRCRIERLCLSDNPRALGLEELLASGCLRRLVELEANDSGLRELEIIGLLDALEAPTLRLVEATGNNLDEFEGVLEAWVRYMERGGHLKELSLHGLFDEGRAARRALEEATDAWSRDDRTHAGLHAGLVEEYARPLYRVASEVLERFTQSEALATLEVLEVRFDREVDRERVAAAVFLHPDLQEALCEEPS